MGWNLRKIIRCDPETIFSNEIIHIYIYIIFFLYYFVWRNKYRLRPTFVRGRCCVRKGEQRGCILLYMWTAYIAPKIVFRYDEMHPSIPLFHWVIVVVCWHYHSMLLTYKIAGPLKIEHAVLYGAAHVKVRQEDEENRKEAFECDDVDDVNIALVSGRWKS